VEIIKKLLKKPSNRGKATVLTDQRKLVITENVLAQVAEDVSTDEACLFPTEDQSF
jgi:hypothetical protein